MTWGPPLLKYATGSELPMVLCSQWSTGLGGVSPGGKALPSRSCPAPSSFTALSCARVAAAALEVLIPPREALSPGLESVWRRVASLVLFGGSRTRGGVFFGWSCCPIWGMWRTDGKETHVGGFTGERERYPSVQREERRALQPSLEVRSGDKSEVCKCKVGQKSPLYGGSILFYCVLSCFL